MAEFFRTFYRFFVIASLISFLAYNSLPFIRQMPVYPSKSYRSMKVRHKEINLTKIKEIVMKNSVQDKNILFLNFREAWLQNNEEIASFESCPITKCKAHLAFFKNNTYEYPKNISYDAFFVFGLVWSSWQSSAPRRMPGSFPPRHPDQVWIFYIHESPRTEAGKEGDTRENPISRFGFNWTMSYRESSELYFPYRHLYLRRGRAPHGGFWNKLSPITTGGPDMSKKTGLVYWYLSHCNTTLVTSKRVEYVRELEKYIPVDIFGKCGNIVDNCTDNSARHMCPLEKSQKYKFYLAFENSLCKDGYLTEKLWRTLQFPTVPVVLGGSDYKRVAPDHSYINVFDFDGPKDLAEYLLYLDKNDDKYLEYFHWKPYYNGYYRNKPDALCELCAKLHDPDLKPNTYKDLHNWFFKIPGTDENFCNSPKSYRDLSSKYRHVYGF